MSEWITILVAVITNVLSVLDIILIIKLFFGIEISWHYYWKIGAIYAGIYLLLELFLKQLEWVSLGLAVIYIVVIECWFIKKQRWRILFYTLSALCIYAQYEMLLSSVMKYIKITQYYIVLGKNAPILSMLNTLLIFIMLAVILYFLEKKHPLVPLGTGGTIFLTVFSFFSPALLSLLEFVEESIQNDRFSFLCIVFMILLNTAVIYGIFYHQNAKFYQNVSQNYKQQFTSEYQYFQGYKQQQQDTARFRHDWKNHMLLLHSMFERREYEKAEEYFAALSEQRVQGSYQSLSGNEIIDMIFYAKADQIAQAEIHLSCDGSLSVLEFMEPVDCCILFANLIDNAIEANLAVQGRRFIMIRGVRHPGTMMIRIENPTAQAVTRAGNQLVSTKKDSVQHGIGSRNAFEIIEKYAGEYFITTEDNMFVFQMIFPLEA